MRLSEYVARYIVQLGVKRPFVLNGSAIADMIDALARIGVPFICPVHEQAGSFAAEIYTKVSGKIGVNVVTSGPGGTNLLTGIANCWFDSIPNLYITGQVNSNFIRKDSKIRQVGFQENDIVAMAKPITKYAALILDPSTIKMELDRAVFEATTGRPGPVLLDIPLDIQKADIDADRLHGFEGKPIAGIADDYQIEETVNCFLDDLERSERPVFLGGGGIHLSNAAQIAREAGSALGIPCLPTWNALDVFASDFPCYRGRVGTYGGPGRNFAIQNADLLLTVGSRISGRITGGVPEYFARKAFKYMVDIDPINMDPNYQPVPIDRGLCCDANHFLSTLVRIAKERKLKKFDWWLNKTEEWLRKYDPVRPQYQNQKDIVNPYVFMEALSNELSCEDIIVADCGGNIVVTSQAFKTKVGQRLCSSNGNSPMGHSFAGAIGAAAAETKGQVICIIGDGGFCMNIQELQTVKNYNLRVKTFILNNHVYGIIKAYQDTNLNSRYEASGPKGYSPPDFMQIAKAYGVAALSISTHADMRQKIQSVLQCDGPVICDVNTHEYFTYEPRIFGWNTPIEDMYPYLPREEFRKNMLIDPVSGWENPIMPGQGPSSSANSVNP